MSLPEQIQKQVDTANQIIAEVYGPGSEENPGSAGNAETPETPAAQPAPVSAASEPVGTSATPATPVEDENSQTYAQRWRSGQGVVKSQLIQLQAAQERIASLENVIAMMNATPAPVKEPSASPLVTDRDREEFGDDMVNFALRAARQENADLRGQLSQALTQIQTLGQQFQHFQGQVAPAVNRVVQVQQRNANDEFFGALTAQIPTWEAINSDPAFHRWLLAPDPMTGITRQAYLADAQKDLDATRVLSIFNAYLSVTGAPSASNRVAPTNELELQVAPGRSMSASSPAAAEARRWTRAEISKVYDDYRRGQYKGREAEFKALETDIFAANKEGRIS